MNALMKSPLKVLTGLFDHTAKSRKALKRAREREREAETEVNRLAMLIHFSTVPDPGLHAVRLSATEEQIQTWQDLRSAALAALAEARTEVNRLEGDLYEREAELSGRMKLATVKEAYEQAKTALGDAQRDGHDLTAKIKQAETALEERIAVLERLRQTALTPETDEAASVAAIQTENAKIANAEMLVDLLKTKRGELLTRINRARETLEEWEHRFWGQVANETFTPNELHDLRQRLVRAYAARLMSNANPTTLYGYALKLLDLDGKTKPDVVTAKATLRREYGVD